MSEVKKVVVMHYVTTTASDGKKTVTQVTGLKTGQAKPRKKK